jgi:hypothetical protein
MAKRKPKSRRPRVQTSPKKQKSPRRRHAVIPPEPVEEDAAVAAAEEKTCKKLMEEFGFSADALSALREFRRIHGGGLY